MSDVPYSLAALQGKLISISQLFTDLIADHVDGGSELSFEDAFERVPSASHIVYDRVVEATMDSSFCGTVEEVEVILYMAEMSVAVGRMLTQETPLGEEVPNEFTK